MPNSDTTMDRLEKIEADVGDLKTIVVQISGILVDHSNRFDSMQRSIDSMQRSIDSVQRSIDAMHQTFGDMKSSTEQRLDRLITVTIEERTRNYERLNDIERRLARLEERFEP